VETWKKALIVFLILAVLMPVTMATFLSQALHSLQIFFSSFNLH